MMAPPESDTHFVLVKALTILFLCLDVAVRRIPEDWKKAPSCALLRLEVVAKLNDIILDIIQLRVSCSYDGVIGELRDSDTTG